MDKKSFNLVTEPWIQVLDKDGNPKEVSLLEVFENAASYQRLAGDMASQDLVILRLLVAILTTVYSRIDANGKNYEWLTLDEKMHLKEAEEEDYEYDDLVNTWQFLYKNLSLIFWGMIHSIRLIRKFMIRRYRLIKKLTSKIQKERLMLNK